MLYAQSTNAFCHIKIFRIVVFLNTKQGVYYCYSSFLYSFAVSIAYLKTASHSLFFKSNYLLHKHKSVSINLEIISNYYWPRKKITNYTLFKLYQLVSYDNQNEL